MSDLKDKLQEYGCSEEFIDDAMRYAKLYDGNIDDFLDRVEEILQDDDTYEEDEIEEEENDPIFVSDYNYDGNDEDIYFEEEEEEFEEDEEDGY